MKLLIGALGLCLGTSLATTACLTDADHEGGEDELASASAALDFDLPLPPIQWVQHTLQIHTCNVTNGESNDPAQLVIQRRHDNPDGPDEFSGSTIDLGTPGATRGAWSSHAITILDLPYDLNQLSSLVVKKRGNDAWCIDRVQIVHDGFAVWRWDPQTKEAGPPNPRYVGPTPIGQNIWLDDQRADAPTSSVRFADYWVYYRDLDDQRPLELEVQTCSAAQSANPGTNDPVEIAYYHDGEIDTIELDNPGNDREAGQVDRYLLDEQGVRAVPFFTLVKKGTDRWCVQKVRLFAAGQLVFEKSGTWLLDDQPVDAPSGSVRIDSNVIVGTLLTDFYGMVGLPLADSEHWTWGQGKLDETCRGCSGGWAEILTCNQCNADLACGEDSTCEPAGGHGELCQEFELSIVGSSPPRCDGSLTCHLNHCRKPGEDLGPCRASGSACDSGLACHAGTCRAPGTELGPCRASPAGYACDGRLTCDDGTCVPHEEVSDTGTDQCVPNVRAKFDALDTSSETKLRIKVPGTNDITQRPAYKLLPFWPGNLASRKDNCHIQGFQRLGVPGFLAFTANSRAGDGGLLNDCSDLGSTWGGGAHLFIGKLASKVSRGDKTWGSLGSAAAGDTVLREVRLNYDASLGIPRDDWDSKISGRYHPGGFQVAGDYLYVGLDGVPAEAQLRIYNVHDPLSPVAVGSVITPSGQASAVAATMLGEGKILIGVGHLSKSGTRKIHMYWVDPSKSKWTPVYAGSVENSSLKPYASINFVRECETDDLYMIGINNDDDFPMCTDELLGANDKGYFHLYKVNYGYSDHPYSISLSHVTSRNAITNNASGCAGTGVYVGASGGMSIYQMEHSSDDGIIRFYEYPTN